MGLKAARARGDALQSLGVPPDNLRRVPDFNYRLLFVGVNATPEGEPLYAAARDALALSGRFRGWGYGDPGRNRILVNDDATAARVLEEVRNAIAEPDLDLLLIYWAGHLQQNGRAQLLATHGARGEKDCTVGLDVLTSAVCLATGVRHRVLILDTCNGEAAVSHLAGLSRYVAEGESLAVLAGRATTAQAREYHRRGYFTGALLEQFPPDTRGVPPKNDLLQALRAGVDLFARRRRQQAFINIAGSEAPLHLPALDQNAAPPKSLGSFTRRASQPVRASSVGARQPGASRTSASRA